MNFNSVNGVFLQLESLLYAEKDMNEALANACSILVERNFAGFDIRATDWGKMMSHNPSMLDWVGHLLSRKENRLARCEIRNAFQEGAVEKAVRLADTRSRCCLEDEGRHSHECASKWRNHQFGWRIPQTSSRHSFHNIQQGNQFPQRIKRCESQDTHRVTIPFDNLCFILHNIHMYYWLVLNLLLINTILKSIETQIECKKMKLPTTWNLE